MQGVGWDRRPAARGRAYSLELRERVAAAVAEGRSCRAVAAAFPVSVSSVVRWSGRARETGSPAAFPAGGARSFKLAGKLAGEKEYPRGSLIIGAPARAVRVLDAEAQLLASAAACVANWRRFAAGLRRVG